MGTRNLTAVMHDGKYKLAQYAQWDGYPSGQGITALEFCRKYLTKKKKLNKFISQLDKVRFVSGEEHKELWKSIGVESEFVTFEQSALFDQRWPYFSRDHGAAILKMVLKSEDDEILVSNSIDFAQESLFCEYAYVIDLDKNTFEVYKGFNKYEVDEDERFYQPQRELQPGETLGEYKCVKHWATFQLDNLPSNDAFLEVLAEHYDEDE